METTSYYYNCSPEYIHVLDPSLHNEILDIVSKLPKRRNQSEINGGPNSYFAHRKSAISGMANFDIAKNTLTTLGLNVPVWLVGSGGE